MQTWSGQDPSGISAGTRKLLTRMLIIFSLAGLVIGFAVGGLTGIHPAPTQTAKNITKTVISTRAPATATVPPTAIADNVPLDLPDVTKYTISEVNNGTTNYTFSAQPVYKNSRKPVSATDITCRLWLTQSLDQTNSAMKANNYALLRNVGNLTQSFPQEVGSSLAYVTPSTQVQFCSANGPTTWTYTLANSVQPGSYYLYVLVDWKGIHFNWSARQIQVIA
ncbi:MAG TPA: hypothetical protein VGD98_09310 [Ktedonobacteraceae bacterium]